MSCVGREPERAQHRRAFGGHGQVGRSGGDDDDRARPRRRRAEDHGREGPALGDGARADAARRGRGGDRLDLGLGRPGQQDRAVGRREELLDDGRTVLGRLARAVDGFGHAEAQVAVMVHPGEPQVGVGQAAQLPDGVVRRAAAGGDVFDERAKRGSVHDLLYPAQL